MSELLVTNAIVIPMNAKDEIIPDGALAIRDRWIVALGKTRDLEAQFPLAERINADGMVVMPGLVNTHTHLSMTMTRSIADDVPAVNWLPVIWAVEKHLKPETVYAGALLGIAEMILSGTTTFNDHYFHMEQVARAVAETGIRAELAEGILENRDRKKGLAGLEKGKAFAAEWHGKAEGRIRTRIGPHALYTCSTDLVVKARQAADELGVGMHMHVAESALEMKMVGKKAAGATSVQHLDALGVLREDFCLAHGLTIDEQDMEILAGQKTGIAHCPQAYAKVGGWPFPAIDGWVKAGITVGLGTDGVASNNNLDMFDEMRFAALVRKLAARDGSILPARQIMRIATIDGARVLGLADQIGSLETGKKADVIMIRLRSPHLYPLHNLPGHLVYSASGADVDTVIVDGKILLRGRKFLSIDLDEILERGQREFESLLRRAGWSATLEEPKVSLAAALKLKVTQQSLKMIQILAGVREPDADETF